MGENFILCFFFFFFLFIFQLFWGSFWNYAQKENLIFEVEINVQFDEIHVSQPEVITKRKISIVSSGDRRRRMTLVVCCRCSCTIWRFMRMTMIRLKWGLKKMKILLSWLMIWPLVIIKQFKLVVRKKMNRLKHKEEEEKKMDWCLFQRNPFELASEWVKEDDSIPSFELYLNMHMNLNNENNFSNSF